MTITNYAVSKLTVAFVAAAMLLTLAFAPVAKAATNAELQAQIDDLLEQIKELQKTSGSTSTAAFTFTRDLTVGSTGEDVEQLQMFLNSNGYAVAITGAGSAGMETMYFGPLTKAAVAKYQVAEAISPAVGYFGPITRAAVNAAMPVAADDDDDTDDDANDDDDDGELEGGAGSVDSYTLMTGLSGEEVGEDAEDVEVAGIEIEVDDGSDIEITAVRLVFDEGSATEDFEDYASEVSLWLDGEEVGRADADKFTDDNDWTKTISLDDAVIRADETGELVVAVSGASTIDSGDVGDTWTVDFRQIRFVDANNASISEDPSTGTRTFSFESFATASDTELKIADGDEDINDSRVIEVHASNDTDNVEVLSFTLEAEGDSDLEINDFGVNVDVTGALNVDEVLTGSTTPGLHLMIDGAEYGTADYFDDADDAAVGADEDVLFDDVDYTLKAGDTVDVVITADFTSIADVLDEGDTITFTLGETESDQATLIDVEDESGEQLADADITGTTDSGAFELRSLGVMVTFVSASEVVSAIDSADNDTGTFTIKFDVEAFGGTVYVASSSAATTDDTVAGGTILENLFVVQQGGTATVTLLSDATTETGDGTLTGSVGNYQLDDGEEMRLTLAVSRTNTGGPDNNGLFRMLLAAVGWDDADAYGTYNIYNFDMDDYQTDYVSLD